MIKTQYSEIKRKGKSKPVTAISLEEVKLVVHQKFTNIKSQRQSIIKKNDVTFNY